MKKILVIGGAGYIGSHIVYDLIDSNYSVTILDDLSTGNIENIDSRSEFIRGSFLDAPLLNKILPQVETIVHLAALKAAGESMSNPMKYSNQNIIGTLRLIDLCIENSVKNFIFSSSAAVYGTPIYLPIDEKHPLKPINYYGFTKKIVESQLLWYNKLKAMNIACLRYFNAAGYDSSCRILGLEKNPANLLPIIMEVAIGKRKSLEVFGNNYDTPDGTCLRDYIHVSDLSIAHIQAIKTLENRDRIILNLGTGYAYSVLEVLKEAELVTGKKINYKITDKRKGDPAELYTSSISAKKILHWEPSHSDIKNILSTMWEIYKSN